MNTRAETVHPLAKFDGQRLAFVQAHSLRVTCHCGHGEDLALADLIAQFGEKPRIRTLLQRLVCTECGETNIKLVARIGNAVGVPTHDVGRGQIND